MACCKRMLAAVLAAVFSLLVQVHAVAASGVFLQTQAEAGKQLYSRHCTDCHLASLRGSGHGPQLAGADFLNKWGERNTEELFLRLQNTMPPVAPRTCGKATF